MTPAGRSAWDSEELWFHQETQPAELPLLLREPDERLWEHLVGVVLTPVATAIPVLVTLILLRLLGRRQWRLMIHVPRCNNPLGWGSGHHGLELTSSRIESSISDSSAAISSESSGPTASESSEGTDWEHCSLPSFFCLLFCFHSRLRSYRLHSMSDQ